MFCITPELYRGLKRPHLGLREVRVGDRMLLAVQDAAQRRVDAEGGLRTFAQRWLSW